MAERYAVKKDSPDGDGVVIPENVQLKRRRNEELRSEKEKECVAAKTRRRELRSDLKERTLKNNQEYEATEAKLVALRRQAKQEGNFFVEPEPKLLFVVRIVGINKLSPKPRKVLQLLRLRQLHNGVFLKVNKATLHMLKAVQPYVTYGYPSLKTVRGLIYKRGFGKVNKQRIPLMNNDIISSALGDKSCHGVEDIVHEIYTVGESFKQVNNFLWPFKLSAPRGGFVCKRHGFCEQRGGDWGNREVLINGIVKRML